jgi:hypothetical protein
MVVIAAAAVEAMMQRERNALYRVLCCGEKEVE